MTRPTSDRPADPHVLTSVDALLERYPLAATEPPRGKESAVLTPAYAAIVAASPFCVGHQTSHLSVVQSAVAFMGSMVAWFWKGTP